MRPLIVVLAFFTVWPAMAAAPVYREIRDFVVACDNTRACRVLGFPEGGGEYLILDLRRDAGPAGKAVLRLSASRRFAASEFRLDGRPSALSALPWRDAGSQDEGALELRDADAIEDFVDLVRNGGALTTGRGESLTVLSLSGFSAALLLVDDAQGRLDTQTAWLRRGTKPAASVPPADALPVLPATPKAPPPLSQAQGRQLIAAIRRQQAALMKAEECDEANDISPDQAFALDGDEALLLLNCITGAYQSAGFAFRVPRDGKGPAKRIALQAPVRINGDSGRIDWFINGDYDPATAMLSHFAKGRGLADCGEAASWRYDGRDFKLASYESLGRCGGMGPGDWPTLYRTSAGKAR